MGTIRYSILMILFFFFGNAQKFIIVKIEKTDSIQLNKYETNGYYLRIYKKENIKYNINKKRTKRVDGIIECEGCKKEYDVFTVKQVKQLKQIKQVIDLKDFYKIKFYWYFSNGYFLLNGKYYKSYGTVIE